jgi:L-amino acid N-acyltransferase YncA
VEPVIRAATLADAADICAIYAPIVRDTSISFETEPPDVSEFERRVRETLPVLPWLVCESESRVLGYAYAGLHRSRLAYQWSVEVSVYLAEVGRRRGIGSRLYRALLDLLTRQGYFNAYRGITLPNAASVGLHEALGFRPVGVYQEVGYKFGRWHDVGWWQKRLRNEAAVPAAPRRFSELSPNEDWQSW